MPRNSRRYRSLGGNIKDQWEDEAPEWLEEDEISDYNTFVSLPEPSVSVRRFSDRSDHSVRV
jgi:hypothetical protein